MIVKLTIYALAALVNITVNINDPSATKTGPDSQKRVIYGLTVHCTEGLINTDQIRDDHLKRGWSDCGYNFWISQKGMIVYLRPVSETGAHAGKNNLRNYTDIGIALEDGRGYPVNERQFDRLIQLAADLCRQYDIVPSSATITRHHEKCPSKSFPLEKLIAEVKRIIDEKRPLTFLEFQADRKTRPALTPVPPVPPLSHQTVPTIHNREKSSKPSRPTAKAFSFSKRKSRIIF